MEVIFGNSIWKRYLEVVLEGGGFFDEEALFAYKYNWEHARLGPFYTCLWHLNHGSYTTFLGTVKAARLTSR
jgi:hypothetical protein